MKWQKQARRVLVIMLLKDMNNGRKKATKKSKLVE